MNRALALLFALAAALPLTAAAQPAFTEITPTGDPLFVTPDTEDFWVNAVAPADVDGDGDLDLAVIGFYVVYNVSAEDRLVLFLNDGPDANGDWLFTHVDVPLGTLSAGASDLAWGDYDADGDPDLAVGSNGETAIYRNDAGALSQVVGGLAGYFEDSSYTGAYDLRSLTWADSDNDGDLDLLVPSVFDFDVFEWQTILLRNDGDDGAGGWLFTDAGAALDGTPHAQSFWSDDDGDNDLDLFLANIDPFFDTGFIRRYQNDGGTFTGTDLIGIGIEYGSADWGDYDADGDMDIIVAGNIQEVDQTFNTVLRVYTNDGGSYSETTLIDAPSADWLDLHAATWADYDSDGDMDLLITGNFVGPDDIEGKSEVYGNDGGVFTALGVALPAPISSSGRGGTFTWLDIDNDGDLDYFVGGSYFVPGGNGLVESQLHIFQNDAIGANAAPEAPAGLDAIASDDSVLLSWTDAVDDLTPAAALTYDLEVQPSGAFAPSAIGRRLPEPGGLSSASTWELRGLPEGSYTWTVRAVDSAFNEGAPAEGSFTIGPGGEIAVGGSVGGLDARRARCRNLSTGQQVTAPVVSGGWDCTAAGLTAGDGETVVMNALGVVQTTPVTGSVSGITPVVAVCRNVTTGERSTGQLDGSDWSCADLAATPGDRVVALIRGTR